MLWNKENRRRLELTKPKYLKALKEHGLKYGDKLSLYVFKNQEIGKAINGKGEGVNVEVWLLYNDLKSEGYEVDYPPPHRGLKVPRKPFTNIEIQNMKSWIFSHSKTKELAQSLWEIIRRAVAKGLTWQEAIQECWSDGSLIWKVLDPANVNYGKPYKDPYHALYVMFRKAVRGIGLNPKDGYSFECLKLRCYLILD